MSENKMSESNVINIKTVKPQGDAKGKEIHRDRLLTVEDLIKIVEGNK